MSCCNDDDVIDIEPVSKKVRTDDTSEFRKCHSSKTSTASYNNKRKKTRSLHNQHSLMKQKAERFNKGETDYYFENGFRKVYPYYFTFHTFCKGRWLGKSLQEIFTNEFRFHSIEHYERARECGHLQVNMKPVKSLDVKLKDNDLLSSKLHRHEAPVIDAKIEIVHEDTRYLVVNKPSSIPIHPCGRYRNNTLCYILRKEHGYESLFGCHRLDRLTSGIVIFAKTKHFANKIITEIRERKVEKEYVCKVVGEFPSDPEGVICDEVVTAFDRKIGCNCAWKVDGFDWKEATTHFFRLSYDGTTSLLVCKPKTGRTHQIRVHLQYLGFPIVNDPMYNHEAWGNERFKHGPCTKNVMDIALAISRTYENDAHVMLSNPVAAENVNKIKQRIVSKSSESNIVESIDIKTSSDEVQTSTSEVESLLQDVETSPSVRQTSCEVGTSLNEIKTSSSEVEIGVNESKASSDGVEAFSKSSNAVETSSIDVKTSSTHDKIPSSEAETLSNCTNVCDKDRFCATCPECVKPLPDPDLRWMTMYLHAYRYKGSDWEFQTEMPKWATLPSNS